MANKKNTKKVNQLKLEECKAILDRLAGQTENKYYQHVLDQYRKLMPSYRDAVELGKTPSNNDATLPPV
jgi:hypothetical protein